jgi:hypothetical protein
VPTKVTDPAMRASPAPANRTLRFNFTISSLRVGMRLCDAPH